MILCDTGVLVGAVDGDDNRVTSCSKIDPVSTTIRSMSQVVIDLSDDDAGRLAQRAQLAQTTPERLAAEAVHTYLHPRRQLSFVGLGASGTHDTAARVEEILRNELDL